MSPFTDYNFGVQDDGLLTFYKVPHMKVLVDTVNEPGSEFLQRRKRARDLAYGKLLAMDATDARKHSDTLKDFVTSVNEWTYPPEHTYEPEAYKTKFKDFLQKQWVDKWSFLDTVHTMSYDVCGHLDAGSTCSPSYVDFIEDVILPPQIGQGDFIFNNPSYVAYRNAMMDNAEEQQSTSAPDSLSSRLRRGWLPIIIIIIITLGLMAFVFFFPEEQDV